jgi:protein-disulfide isomerase
MSTKENQQSFAARTAGATKSTGAARGNQGLIIGGVVAAAVIAAVVLILLSGNTNTQTIDYASLNPTRNAEGAFVIGDPNAPITLVEFADFGCPHCQTYHSTIQTFITEQVVTGRARFEYRIYPTAGGQTSVFTGKISECIDDASPGAFWNAYDQFFDLAKTGRYFEDGAARTVVQSLGLSYSDIIACSETANQVTVDMNFGNSKGVQGTPAVMVRYGDGDANWITFGGTTYNRGSVTYDVLAAVVEQANTGTISQ